MTAWTEPPYTVGPPTGGTGTPGGPGVLAYTGSDLVGIASVAGLFLVLGAALLVATRRRGRHGGW